MQKRNQLIRETKGNIPNWLIAERLEIHESTLVRWLRQEMSPEQEQRIINVIEQLKEEGIK